ncbi:MAG: TIM barrel protein [Treponemataceae bacterium]
MVFKKSACIEALYTELPFFDRFQAAKNDGFDYIEFWNYAGRDIEDIKKAAQKAAIGIAGFNGDADFSLVDPTHKKKYLEYLKQSVEIAKKIGALSVTIHSNALGDQGIVVNHYKELSDTVKICSMYDTLLQCAKIANTNDICMNLEPLNIKTDHKGNFLETTQMAAEITTLIGCEKLKVLYDVYHMQLNEGALCDTISKYVNQFGHIHVADAPCRHEPGTGEINYAKIFSHLELVGYRGIIGFELFPKTTTQEAVKAIMSY